MLNIKSAQKGVLATLLLLIYLFATWVSFEAQEKKVNKLFVESWSTVDTSCDADDFYSSALPHVRFQEGTQKSKHSPQFQESATQDLLHLEFTKFDFFAAPLPDFRLIIVALCNTDIIYPFHSFL